jgi:hypothetical protein
MLCVSKVPALLQHAFLVGQATVATLPEGGGGRGRDKYDDAVASDAAATTTGRRAAALARMTTAYTIGATLGPAIGGYLASGLDLYAGARLAVWGSLASVLISMICLGGKEDRGVGVGGGGSSRSKNDHDAAASSSSSSLTGTMASGMTAYDDDDDDSNGGTGDSHDDDGDKDIGG